MSSSFPQFSADEIILRYGSQDLYFMIIHNSVTLTAAKPGSFYYLFREYYLLVLSLHDIFNVFRNLFSENSETIFCKFRNSETTFRKFPVYGKKSYRKSFLISGTFSIMEIKKFPDHFRT